MISQEIYNFSFADWLNQMTSPLLRRPKMLDLLTIFVQRIETLQDAFDEFREKCNYKIAHTAQVIHVEKVLNDAFDDAERRIYITNVNFEAQYTYLWPQGEEPHHLQEEDADPDNPLFLLEAQATQVQADATIWVPSALEPEDEIEAESFEADIRALTDEYIFYGINYQILYYDE